MLETMNMFSAIQNFMAQPVGDPDYADLSVGYSYAVVVMNTTANDVTSGELVFQGANHDPADICKPGPFEDLEPVSGCASIVSGIPEVGPVSMTFTPQRPIRAHSTCQFAVPCPAQFLKVTGLPAGCFAVAIVSNLRRTDWAHLGPMGYIPQSLQLGT